MPDFPERWTFPIKEIKKRLREVLVNDFDDGDNPIKRKLTHEEINELANHWKDMVKYSKMHFKDSFDPFIMEARPYLRFIAIADSRTCDFCKALNNKVIRSDDPRAIQFFPPLHIGCRCTMLTASERELERDGLKRNWPNIDLPDVFSVSLL